MFIDGRTVENKKTLNTDICVVGGGAAGITFARQFVGSTFTICLLETGGFDFDPVAQSFTEGSTEGNVLKPNPWYLNTTRLRYFGGTTNHWDGWCRPLDPLDFQTKSWISHSGWPLSRNDLEIYYQKAAKVCAVAPFLPPDQETRATAAFDDPPVFPFRKESQIITKLFHLPDEPVRFGKAVRPEFEKSQNIKVWLNSNVIRLKLDKGGKKLEAVLAVATGTNKTFQVKAKIFILATGGIENARLLLASDDVAKHGIGNDRDLVGRYFMDHLYVPVGCLVARAPKPLVQSYVDSSAYKNLGVVHRAFCPTPTAQTSQKILNFCLMTHKYAPIPQKGREGFGALMKLDEIRNGETPGDPDDVIQSVALEAHAEQSPNPDSRVVLDSARDAAGQRRAKLLWNITASDKNSIFTGLKLLADEVGALNRGHVMVVPALEDWKLEYGAHHMGTTRMAASAADGVVDSQGRVHDVDNLFIAGSSLFPTSGFANPTLTIVALALRLADHVKSLFSGGIPK